MDKKLYHRISVSWQCAWGCSRLLFPVTAAAAPCALSACFPYQLAVQGGRGGCAGQACSRTKYRALSVSYTCRKSRVSSVVKCIWFLSLSFPFSLISPHNLACLFWGKQKEFCCCWMLAQVVILSHLISMSLIVRSGLWLYGCQDWQFSKFQVLNLKIFNSCWFSEVVIPSV